MEKMEKSEQAMTAFEIMVKRKRILKQAKATKDLVKREQLYNETHRLAHLARRKGGLSQEEVINLSLQ